MFPTRAPQLEGRHRVAPLGRTPEALTPPETEVRPVARLTLPEAERAAEPATAKPRPPASTVARAPAAESMPVEASPPLSSPARPAGESSSDLARRPLTGKERTPVPPSLSRPVASPAAIAVRLADMPRGVEVSARLFGAGERGDSALRDRIAALLESHGLRLARWSLNGVLQSFAGERETD